MKKLVVVSSAPLVFIDEEWFLYSPYEKEMQLWAKHSQSIQFCSPIWKESKNLLIAEVGFAMEAPIVLKEFDIRSIKGIFKAISSSIYNIRRLYSSFKTAEHIHLRCPGNVALLASFVQILFPNKPKTAKYAGNWDPKSKQPWSYKLQKWILSNTLLTKNMQVLVYGAWPNQTKNIKSFFTATYAEKEIQKVAIQKAAIQDVIKFLFVGMLSEGKQPLYVIQFIEQLHQLDYKVNLDLYGEGVLRKELEDYIADKHLGGFVHLKGNQTKESVEKAYQESHFLVLPSKSEGWPKVVAEAMFWGCVPLVTPVSCVPYMVDFGKRGILLQMNLDEDTKQIKKLLQDDFAYQEMSKNGRSWSQHYTTDLFEKEISSILSH